VKPGDSLFLNDGIIHLEVFRVDGNDVECRVIVGGELRSRKGINLPGIDLGISAFTDRDHECLKFAMENGVDAVSQSFVETAADIEAVRKAAKELGHEPFIVAKIERSGALKHMDKILQATDGIMIARGDLGVEIPIEEMAVVQKNLMEKAVVAGKPVITATQMLESMVDHSRPTRAEATDVANAIFDGTDCVMLSGESAMGKFPIESVAMLSKIAKATEPHRPGYRRKAFLETYGLDKNISRIDLIALSVYNTLERSSTAGIFVPTISGATARKTCQKLQFSYGVYPVWEPEHPEDWNMYAREWVKAHQLKGNIALLTEGPSPRNPDANHRMELIDLKDSQGE
jgi:pyruvate kinase